MKKKSWFYLVLLIILFITLFTNTVFAALSPRVFVIPVESTIDLGLASFIDRSYKEAEALAVDLVLLEIDTPGGRVDAAQEIKKRLPIVLFLLQLWLKVGLFLPVLI